MLDLVRQLLKVESDLVVTVTAPLDRRRPGNDEDRIRVRNLLATAKRRVLERWDADRARPLLEALDGAASRVELGGGALGMVIVATAEGADVHLVPFSVREDVVLGTTPATRSLVQGLRRSPRYRVLVLSDRATRLFEAIRDDLVEVRTHGFPFAADIIRRDRRAVAGRFALAPGSDDKESWRNFYREVDNALAEVSRNDALPIVIAGVKRSTVRFEEVSRHRHLLAGRIPGAHEHASEHQLGAAAWAIMRERLEVRRAEATAELTDALHAGKAATGIDEVWRYAREGRGRLLVVEEDYRGEPSREIDGVLVLSSGAESADVIDDPVDEIIEHVVRAGGTVEFVAPDALAGFDRIGLVLR